MEKVSLDTIIKFMYTVCRAFWALNVVWPREGGTRPPFLSGRAAGPAVRYKIQEVYENGNETYLSAQEAPWTEGSWLPQTDGHRQRSEGPLPPPREGPRRPVLLRRTTAKKWNRSFRDGGDFAEFLRPYEAFSESRASGRFQKLRTREREA